MAVSPLALVERFRGLRVLVVGEAMLDSYVLGTSPRLCREAPVPIVAVARRDDVPGGAANTAVNVRQLGAAVTLLSAVGADRHAEVLEAALRARDVGADHVAREPHRLTLAKQRVLAGGHMLVRVDEGSIDALDGEAQARLIARLTALWEAHDAVVVSDYGYGILTARVVAALAALQARAPRVVAVDSKTLLAYRHVRPTVVKPNYEEARALLARPGRNPRAPREPRSEVIARHGGRILGATSAQIAAVTLDTDGALFFERGRPPYRTYAQPVDHARAAGAGDTFVAALCLALAAGGDLSACAEIASAAAAVVVAKDGTAACSAAELRGSLSPRDRYTTLEALRPRLELYRRQGRRLVFTNGCFDILHRGHVTYLNSAKALGDVLVVALNDDAGVGRLKGPGRPINGLEDRAQVLAALSCVDHIVAFAEDTPVDLVRAIRPAHYVKGGDYAADILPEAPVVRALGGEVRILPYVEERSTTSIIERVRAAARCDGARPRAS
jgi:D-beta-D-heptose 7-phosphate kinase/D-beta-D-heptose 1-phosphate adenosyltransferase